VAISERAVDANGLRFALLEDGPADGPLALCLHGFPDSAWGWRYLLPALARDGFHAVAPFMRGYAPTSVPADGVYFTGALAMDANALHEALGGDNRAVIIGHDWGATATYGATGHRPDLWRRVVTAAVPPISVFGQGLFQYRQLRRSWYFFFFQHPLSDMVLPANDLEFIDHLWEDWSPGHDGTEDIGHVKDCLRAPENLNAAIGYYRAAFGGGTPPPELAGPQVAGANVPPQPTLYLHGRTDGCVGVELAEGVQSVLSAGSEVAIIDGAGHFMQVEKPDEVNQRILNFIKT
jgi:pimeloyl-ACP methyl ester carboxylesterase